ncbi:MAG TPA: hypothetical protein VHL57_00110, partial [Flavobacteriales bacterium]|nr:hypothetical protein [Flavobacteriales bacterium]
LDVENPYVPGIHMLPEAEVIIAANGKGKVLAEKIYLHARPNYHSVSIRTIDEMMGYAARVGTISL